MTGEAAALDRLIEGNCQLGVENPALFARIPSQQKELALAIKLRDFARYLTRGLPKSDRTVILSDVWRPCAFEVPKEIKYGSYGCISLAPSTIRHT
jgi:hypothetical protein